MRVPKNAKEFKGAFSTLLEEYNDYIALLNNVANFKSLVTKIYKKIKLESCLDNISNNENGYRNIKYDSKFNSDVLHKMLISHDTLLEYSLKIIKNYDLLKRIIIHQYPYILIDEYQDTNEDVIKIMALLSEYARNNNCKLFLGYFGDTAQNIYDDGIGDKIYQHVGNIGKIDKPYNRRSTQEIIHVINHIRDDNIEQKSIYEDSTGGSVKFYNGQEKNIDAFIDYYKGEWGINKSNKLHCLVLTNKLVAKYNKFPTIYDKISNTEYYKQYYQSINTELLSNELNKLGEIPFLLYQIVDLKLKLENNNTIISEVIPSSIYKNLTFEGANKIIHELRQINKEANLKDFLSVLFNKCNELNNTILKNIIENHINFQDFNFTFEGFTSNLLNKLSPNESDNENALKIEEILIIDFEEYKNWHNFLNESSENEVIYHTYHGTKGEEYDNVIVVMEINFGKDKNKFSTFFLNYGMPLEDNEAKSKFNHTRNLFYVACSRAIKNLRVLYLDNTDNFQDKIKRSFGEIYNVECLFK